MVASDWALLWEEMESIKGENVSVIYDIGHGNSIVVSKIERVGPDFVKLAGHFPLGFVQIKEIKHNGVVLFSAQQEVR